MGIFTERQGRAARTGGGTVFEMTQAGTLTTLYGFGNGDSPEGLIHAGEGNFYGKTFEGGPYGVVFD